MDDDARVQLAIIAQQARAISEAVSHFKGDWLDGVDETNHEFNRLLGQAHGVLGDSPVAKSLPSEVHSPPDLAIPSVSKTHLMAAAQQLATALETFLAHEPGRLEQLEREKVELEAQVREAEARATIIVDDGLRQRRMHLLLQPGRADAAVREACVVLEDRLRKVAGLPKNIHGVDLVDKALNPQGGLLVFSDVTDEQRGMHQLYRGVIGFFKNPTSHRLIEDYDVTRARQVVGLIDALLTWLREAQKRDPQGGKRT